MISYTLLSIVGKDSWCPRGVKTRLIVGEYAKPFFVALAILLVLRQFKVDDILEKHHILEILNRGGNIGREKWSVFVDLANALCHTLAYFAVLTLSKSSRELGSMYFWSPLNYISALDTCNGALCNAALLWALVISPGQPFGAGMLFSVCTFFQPWTFRWMFLPVLLVSIDIEDFKKTCPGQVESRSRSSQHLGLRWRILQCLRTSFGILLGTAGLHCAAVVFSSGNIIPVLKDVSQVIDIGLFGFLKLGWRDLLQGNGRDFSTIEPTIDLHWYLMAEVFPSFR